MLGKMNEGNFSIPQINTRNFKSFNQSLYSALWISKNQQKQSPGCVLEKTCS